MPSMFLPPSTPTMEVIINPFYAERKAGPSAPTIPDSKTLPKKVPWAERRPVVLVSNLDETVRALSRYRRKFIGASRLKIYAIRFSERWQEPCGSFAFKRNGKNLLFHLHVRDMVRTLIALYCIQVFIRHPSTAVGQQRCFCFDPCFPVREMVRTSHSICI